MRDYLEILQIKAQKINSIDEIVFLPIQFFKSHTVSSINETLVYQFQSSGTGGNRSKHQFNDVNTYEMAFIDNFNSHFNNFINYCHLALLPNYLEQGNSSLVYMVDYFIKNTNVKESGFYLHEKEQLKIQLNKNKELGIPTILWAVTFALLDLIENWEGDFPNLIVIETGGMKGRGKELTRAELHQHLKSKFKNAKISSEYGMTELFSQAYWNPEKSVFEPSRFQKIIIRDVNDPFCKLENNRHGAINVIDLANWQSCSFIETADLGIIKANGFEVLGRLDHAEIRGCSLMYF